MARTGFLHHIGTFLLLVATILLIITCISAPVVHDIGLMKVELGAANRAAAHTTINFGTFGWCVNDASGDDCSDSELGYSPAGVMSDQDGTEFSDYARSTTRGLTKAFVLHPIACALNFVAFMLALGAGLVGSLLASMVTLLAFLVTAVAMIIDFVLFSIVRSNINDNGTGARAYYGAAAWTILVSAICSLLGTIIVFFTCCSGRMHKRRQVTTKREFVEPPMTTTRRRRWF